MESLLGLVRHGGNSALFQAVEMSLLSTLYGVPLHLHAEGLRGTGKTTIFRAARRVLPRIRRIKGCLYNCDPAAPHCPHHRGLEPDRLSGLGEEWVPMPFLEISHSAKVGTVVGSIDLSRLVSPGEPAAALLPGTLPQAHRGIVFVDEINRLAETSPELADVLLDAMGTKPGRIQIEETGLPAVELPLTVSVWAASNPDEDPGPLEEIRRQLSDRFDFVIPTTRPGEPAVVAQILTLFDETHVGLATAARAAGRGVAADAVQQEVYRTRVANRAQALAQVEVPPWLRAQVAEIYARFGLESLRAAQAILWGMRLCAGLEERPAATWPDLAAVAPLALHHRVDGETLGRLLQHIRSLQARGDRQPQADIAAGGGPWGSGRGGGPAGQAALAADPAGGDHHPGAGAPGLRDRAGTWPAGTAVAPPAQRVPGGAATAMGGAGGTGAAEAGAGPGGAGAGSSLLAGSGPSGPAANPAESGRGSLWNWVRSHLLRRGGPAGADRVPGGLFRRPEPAAAPGGTHGSLRPHSGAARAAGHPAGLPRADGATTNPGGLTGLAGAAGAGGPGGTAPGSGTVPGGGPAPGGGGPAPGGGAGGRGDPVRPLDPTRVPAVAPPIAARRIASLSPGEWVRTETELDGGSQRWTGSPS